MDEANIDNFTTVTTKMKDMVSLLEKASDDDKTLVLFELQQVVEFDRNFVIENIIPVICQNCGEWMEPVQIPAAEALSTVLRNNISSDLAMKICTLSCDIISNSCDQVNRDLWGEVLVSSLKFCSLTAKQLDRIVSTLKRNNTTNLSDKQSLSTSKLTARILGSMAISSRDKATKKVVLDRAVAMTTVDDDQVRGIIAESMEYIGKSLPISEVEVNQWPTLQRLSQDENACVRSACLKSISNIVEHHYNENSENIELISQSKLFTKLVPSLFYKECSKMRKCGAQDFRSLDEDAFLLVEINSEIFGSLLSVTYDYLPDDTTRKEVYKAFLSLATCNSPIIRKNCACSLPQAAKCFGEKGSAMIAHLVEYLSHDSDDDVRWNVASILHETLPYISNKETIATGFKAVSVLLRDKNWIVRLNLMQHFQAVVAELSKHCSYNNSTKLSILFEQLQLLCDGDWRVQELLVKQLQLTAPLVPPSSMIDNILPLLNRVSKDGTYMVRKAAMGSIATYIRYVPDSLERDFEMRKFSEEWAHGNIYWMRIGFIDAAKVAVQLYSRCLFRDLFALEVLKLADDIVSNVRLRLALLLPDLANACYMMDAYYIAIETLKNDEVVDVREAAEKSQSNIQKKLQVGKKDLESDLKLEEEERELFCRHIQNQREANKKQRYLKKAAGGWWHQTVATFSTSTRLEEIESPVTPAKKSSLTPFSKSNSISRFDEPRNQNQPPSDQTQSAEWERAEAEAVDMNREAEQSKDDSDIFKQSRSFNSFKGLRPFLSVKTSVLKKRNSTMIKKQ